MLGKIREIDRLQGKTVDTWSDDITTPKMSDFQSEKDYLKMVDFFSAAETGNYCFEKNL